MYERVLFEANFIYINGSIKTHGVKIEDKIHTQRGLSKAKL